MTFQTILALVLIGIFAGMMSGFVGIGGGVIIVPALVYIVGLTQHEAQGTSLLLMLPPIGILAVMNYYKAGQMNITYGVIIAIAFVIGGYFGSKLSLQMSVSKVRLIFGILMLYVAIKLIYSGIITTIDEKRNHTESVEGDS
ncbi:MAG: sulfite exporter TauE/SafE family protein [Putridiphycobacter sp.]|nr:sulfite exporter TauE/SafE family protein [Putridiphycobacter sp.]